MRATPKFELYGSEILALYPISLTPSQREPMPTTVQPGSLPIGSNLFHICWTKEFMPSPRGSQGAVPLAPQFVPLAKLKVVGTGAGPPVAWQAALQTSKCTIPLRMSALGTAASKVAEFFHQNPS